MAHAKPQHLEEFDILLNEIRKISQLKEKSFGCFYLKSKGVLHFHIKGERLYAHVFNGNDWIEVTLKPRLNKNLQKALSKKIVSTLPL